MQKPAIGGVNCPKVAKMQLKDKYSQIRPFFFAKRFL